MNPNKKQLSTMSMVGIMAVPLVWLFEASAVGPILGYLPQDFPNASPLSIKMVMTMPFISSVIFSVVSGKLATFMDKKKIILAGLLIYSITGVLPFFANSIGLILVLRFLTGCGVGLIMPLTSSIIAENFDGKKRERLLGWCPALANIMNIGANFLTAAVLALGWRYCFLQFALVFIIFLIALAMPKSPPTKISAEDRGNGVVEAHVTKLPSIVWGMCVLMLFNWCFFGFCIFNLSLFMMSENISGSPFHIAIAMITPAIGSAIVGAIFPEIHKIFKNYTLLIAGIIYGLGFFICMGSDTTTMLSIGCLVVGFGGGVVPPYMLNLTAVRIPDEQKSLAYGLVNSCIHLGYFLSPFVQEIVNVITGTSTDYRMLFQAAGICTIVYGIVCLLLKKKLELNIEIAKLK